MESTNSVLNPVFGSVTIQELHERFDNTDPNIEQHFSMEELARMSEYEKMRLRNIKRNYLAMNAMGIAFSKPDFMQRKIKTKAPLYQIWSSSDTDSDEEWIPNAPKKRPPRLPKMGMVPNKSCPVEKISKKTSDGSRKNCLKRLETDCREEILATSQMPEPETLANIPNNEHPEEEQGKFRGFTDRFIEKRLKALNRAIRHKQRLVDLLESDKLPMTYLDILDPLVLSDDEEFEQDKYGRWMKKKKLVIVSSRYPRRNINRLNYAALEVPSDDEFLYCEDCHREFQGACPEHGPLNFIPEKEEINFSLIGTDLYAKDTLLPYLMIKQSLIRGAGQGVFTQVKLTKNSVFGPYDGQLTKNSTEAQDSGYSWLVFRDSKGHHYVDGQHKGHSNWMRYVNCACNEQEQNLIAFQYQGRIYYKVLHDINPGSELLVWYGDEYAKELGLEVQDNSVELKDNNHLLDDLKVHHKGGVVNTNKTLCPRCKFLFLEDRIHLHNCGSIKNGGVVNTNKTLCPRCKFLFLEDRIHLHNCGSIKNGEGAYQCSDCLQMYGSEEYLVKHRHAKHGVVLPLEYINGKNASFGSEMNRKSRSELGYKALLYSGNNDTSKVSTGENSGLREQIMCYDEIQQFYFCESCVMQFNDFEKYKLHTNEHNGNSEYKKQCPSMILNRSNDCNYKGTYTSKKPYKCQYCDKMFSQLSHIKRHERTHTGEKPYKCQYCDKLFIDSTCIKQHERTHIGEKPYKCQYCDKMFRHLSYQGSHPYFKVEVSVPSGDQK